MAEENNNMLSMDYMDSDSIAFGLSAGTYQALFKEEEEDDAILFSEKAVKGLASSDKGFLMDFGLPDDGLSEKWSLLEQLQLENTNTNHSMSNVMNDSDSSRPPSVCDAFFTEDTCLLSPFSESSDSGVSSCYSPYGDGNIEELDSSLWLQDQFMTDNKLPSEFGDLSNIQILPSSKGTAISSLKGEVEDLQQGLGSPKADIIVPDGVLKDALIGRKFDEISGKSIQDRTVEMFETNQVSFIEESEAPPVLVEEVAFADALQRQPVHIIPAPVTKPERRQPVFIIKTEPVVSKPAELIITGPFAVKEEAGHSVRSTPYPKKKPKKCKTPQQKEKKKHQNRNAASRYRNKKKDELNDLFEEANVLEETNKGLSEKVTSLTKEIDYLKSLMLDVIKARLERSNSQTS